MYASASSPLEGVIAPRDAMLTLVRCSITDAGRSAVRLETLQRLAREADRATTRR